MSSEIGRLWLGAVAAALAVPVLVLAFDAPLWLGAGGAFAVFLAAMFVPERLMSLGLKRGRGALPGLMPGQEPALEAALRAAQPALARLERSAEHAQGPLGERLQRIVDVSRGLIGDVREEPARLAKVQRLLTYYLPSAADIAEGYARLRQEGIAPPARLAAAQSVLAQLEAAVCHFAAQVRDEDLRALDAEIRLVAAALKDDLG